MANLFYHCIYKMKKLNTKFYINPYTGRVIKSSAKTYHDVKESNLKLDKDKCLYNVKSAERCLRKILRLYPYIYPPSSFISIPRTYHEGVHRAFVSNEDSTKIIGVIDKKGNIKKLKREISPTINTPIVQDPSGLLPSVTNKQEQVDEQTQTSIEEQIENNTVKSDNITIVYNPVQNDFVPINEKINSVKQNEIIKTINDDLIPTTLPSITEQSNVAGLVTDVDKISGVVTTNNDVLKLREPVPLEEKHKALPKLESEGVEYSKVIDVAQLDNCAEGELFDVTKQRCLPCSDYDLVWDSKYKKCKVKMINSVMIVNEQNEILGYL
jgi:hypothetical protein